MVDIIGAAADIPEILEENGNATRRTVELELGAMGARPPRREVEPRPIGLGAAAARSLISGTSG